MDRCFVQMWPTLKRHQTYEQNLILNKTYMIIQIFATSWDQNAREFLG